LVDQLFQALAIYERSLPPHLQKLFGNNLPHTASRALADQEKNRRPEIPPPPPNVPPPFGYNGSPPEAGHPNPLEVLSYPSLPFPSLIRQTSAGSDLGLEMLQLSMPGVPSLSRQFSSGNIIWSLLLLVLTDLLDFMQDLQNMPFHAVEAQEELDRAVETILVMDSVLPAFDGDHTFVGYYTYEGAELGLIFHPAVTMNNQELHKKMTDAYGKERANPSSTLLLKRATYITGEKLKEHALMRYFELEANRNLSQ
jgi:hypothetical protein